MTVACFCGHVFKTQAHRAACPKCRGIVELPSLGNQETTDGEW